MKEDLKGEFMSGFINGTGIETVGQGDSCLQVL